MEGESTFDSHNFPFKTSSALTGTNDNINSLFNVRSSANTHLAGPLASDIWRKDKYGKFVECFYNDKLKDNDNLIRVRDNVVDGVITESSFDHGRIHIGREYYGNKKSGSSTLASMLGIELPTGTGSLRESLWKSSIPVPSSFNGPRSNGPIPTPIGAGIKTKGTVIIGNSPNINGVEGIPLCQYRSSGSAFHNSYGNNNDIVLLQSLLPGVHITSGNAYKPAAPNSTSGLFSEGFLSQNNISLVKTQNQDRLCTPDLCNNIQQNTISQYLKDKSCDNGDILSTNPQSNSRVSHIW